MSRGALLTGTAGGIIGAVTAVFGIIWSFITSTFLIEIYNYLVQLGIYLTTVIPGWAIYGYPYPLPLPFYPSWSLFGLSSFILAILLIVTGILIGIGFYGTYKIGGGAMGVVGLIFSIVGVTSGALLIVMGNLTRGYEILSTGMGDVISQTLIPVLTPYFLVILIGFAILGVTFILLGSASIRVREITQKPSATHAAGVLSIIGALVFIIVFIIGALIWPLMLFLDFGVLIDWPLMLIIGFGLILVAFILWAWVFYSSRNL